MSTLKCMLCQAEIPSPKMSSQTIAAAGHVIHSDVLNVIRGVITAAPVTLH